MRDSVLVSPTDSIIDALKVIDRAALQIAIAVDQENRMLGTITDGDIRRGLISGLGLDSPIEKVIHQNPVIGYEHETDTVLIQRMRKYLLHQIPIVDQDQRFLTVKLLDDLIFSGDLENWAVIMAGGYGKRLKPLTDNTPKPLLEVGNRPILETIICNLEKQGFRKVFLAINYLGQQIRDRFGDGSALGVDITYIEEDQPLGTAGSLALLPERPAVPMIVMNGDLLTNVNFRHMLHFHHEEKSAFTMGVRKFKNQVPYGVVRCAGHQIVGLEEKPSQQHLVNAGIYVLDPMVLEQIPAADSGRQTQMPDLAQAMMNHQKTVSAYTIEDYWLDIGRMADFERANNDFPEFFQ